MIDLKNIVSLKVKPALSIELTTNSIASILSLKFNIILLEYLVVCSVLFWIKNIEFFSETIVFMLNLPLVWICFVKTKNNQFMLPNGRIISINLKNFWHWRSTENYFRIGLQIAAEYLYRFSDGFDNFRFHGIFGIPFVLNVRSGKQKQFRMVVPLTKGGFVTIPN